MNGALHQDILSTSLFGTLKLQSDFIYTIYMLNYFLAGEIAYIFQVEKINMTLWKRRARFTVT